MSHECSDCWETGHDPNAVEEAGEERVYYDVLSNPKLDFLYVSYVFSIEKFVMAP